jgi:DNA polymerase-3 subunit alpha (Gram-positive type)
MKRIKEVFSDYNPGDCIGSAVVEGVVLSKKTKILEMKIKSERFISVEDIESLNNFIKKKISSIKISAEKQRI